MLKTQEDKGEGYIAEDTRGQGGGLHCCRHKRRRGRFTLLNSQEEKGEVYIAEDTRGQGEGYIAEDTRGEGGGLRC